MDLGIICNKVVSVAANSWFDKAHLSKAEVLEFYVALKCSNWSSIAGYLAGALQIGRAFVAKSVSML